MLARGLTADEVSDVYSRYGALLTRRCRLLMRDAALAEDAMQELVATLLKRGEGLRAVESKYHWLCRAADRTCIDILRRRKHVTRALDIDDTDHASAAPGLDLEARYVAVQSLANLDRDNQTLAIMLYVDGMSQSEAADELGLSRVTINKRAQQLRAELRLEHAPLSEGGSS